MKRFLALTLVLCLLLCGCTSLSDLLAVPYEDMAYTRPDMQELDEILKESCRAALVGKNISQVEDGIWEFYDAYDEYYTNYYLAYLNYCHDVTDSYWQAEYQFCAENAATVDAGLEELYRSLAQSRLREELESDEYFGADYFDDYEGESFYDEVILSMLEQENALLNQYYDLYQQSLETEYYSETYFATYAQPLCQILVELVRVRQDMAQYGGYPDYACFCYDNYYYRDYTWQEAETYLGQIETALVPLYRQVKDSDLWTAGDADCNEAENFEHLRQVAKAMDGKVEEAFRLLDTAGLYDIKYGENKYDSSFEVYLPTYYQPFIFLNPTLTQWDKLTLVHEFGHFTNDYVSYGSYAGMDVAEVFSQGLEYLSLCYVPDEEMEELKLADCLCTYVEQAGLAVFEHRLYAMAPEELTTDGVFALYKEVGTAYGFDSEDWDPRDLIAVPHIFTNPLYIVSYVVSNDAAFQLYQREKAEPGAGLALYEAQLGTEEAYFLAFLKAAGLDSPFTPGRIEEVRQTLEEILG